jgi:hypothetical protein
MERKSSFWSKKIGEKASKRMVVVTQWVSHLLGQVGSFFVHFSVVGYHNFDLTNHILYPEKRK